MYLRHLSLSNFRNYTRLEVDLSARVHVFKGDNAEGKTNLLESVYYLATTRSPLISSDREIISWEADRDLIPSAYVEGTFVRGGTERTLSITLASEPPRNGEGGKPVLRRQIRVDGVPRRAIDAIGLLNVALFLPQDIGLVDGPPAGRRRYLDVMLCQIDSAYCRALSRYNRVVSHRNALLKQIREAKARRPELEYWDEQLVSLGTGVLTRRRDAVDRLGHYVRHIQPRLTDDCESLLLVYESTVDERAAEGFRRRAGESLSVEERYVRALEQVRAQEIARGVTVVGPHRDDLRFLINGHDATIYASRGQQRTVALALKLGEVSVIREITGETPVLLLDDVISELDRKRSRQILHLARTSEQVLITTTDLRGFTPGFLGEAILWEVQAGSLQRLGKGEGESEED